jgi:fatty-acid peroxygenase
MVRRPLLARAAGRWGAPTGHRCPGEWVVLEVLQVALRLLTRETDYDVPPQDLRVRRNRVPAVPESRFVVQLRR